MDFEAEIAKAQAKLVKASEGVRKQRAIVEDEGYRRKVEAGVQEGERRKLRDLEAECRGLEESVGQFERLRLE